MMRLYGLNSYNGLFGIGIILHILGFLITTAIVVAIIIIAVRLIRRGNSIHPMHEGGSEKSQTPPAIEILDKRLANGDITIEEYKILKEEILKR